MSGEYRLSGLGEGWEGPAMDDFFARVLANLGFSEQRNAAYAQIRSRMLPRTTQQAGEPFHATDDRLTELVFGETTIATALEIRNDLNFAQLLFADYLTPELVAQLQRTTQEP